MHVNGEKTKRTFHIYVDSAEKPIVANLDGIDIQLMPVIDAYANGRLEEAKSLINEILPIFSGTHSGRLLTHLFELSLTPTLLNLASIEKDHVYLSEVRAMTNQVGWDRLYRDSFFSDNLQNSVFLKIGGAIHTKGLYAHSPSKISYAVRKEWKTFKTIVGLRDAIGVSAGSAQFVIQGDDKILYTSKVLKRPETEVITVDISDVSTLTLIVKNGGKSNSYSWSVWAEPLLLR
ncbi:NPCBM/NEW2 domain-containing protein [Psychrosphaera algicola]|uniref:NPCBM/NEW2 domain-containing protein n=1 Tax=Psychrosphaera algicola TaxID=3023714 RepID=A0ABT5FBS3_9GAMM|nr:NPCBM/NEW2 domain-containing protein [Psychrosphaera sp. G1-22]MDC2888987.1 NPCBM/NEW2 domain-containing protein [Psychrosphaera sp. G1-22]